MFVTEMEGEDYTYAHCYEDDDEGTEFGCGMEYEFYPDYVFEGTLLPREPGVLVYWHDAVGHMRQKPMTKEEWSATVRWHEENCQIPDKEA